MHFSPTESVWWDWRSAVVLVMAGHVFLSLGGFYIQLAFDCVHLESKKFYNRLIGNSDFVFVLIFSYSTGHTVAHWAWDLNLKWVSPTKIKYFICFEKGLLMKIFVLPPEQTNRNTTLFQHQMFFFFFFFSRHKETRQCWRHCGIRHCGPAAYCHVDCLAGLLPANPSNSRCSSIIIIITTITRYSWFQ